MKKRAIIIKNKENFEVRCNSCGKLLFTFSIKEHENVDFLKQNVTIVARCTRSGCKTDNLISF